MEIDQDKIDEAALALLYLTIHERCRAYKELDWQIIHRLAKKGLIDSPVGKAKSVVLTEEGVKRSEAIFNKLFSK